jgi:hypothetical protein
VDLQLPQVVLRGDLSSGVQPLSYSWRQLQPDGGEVDGGLFAFASDNDSQTAFQVVLPVPPIAARSVIQLRVTDALGRTSPPTSGLLVASERPAVTLPNVPAEVLGGTTFQLTAAAGDGNTPQLPIITYEWTVESGVATLEPLGNGQTVRVTTNNLGAPTTLKLGVRVFNSYGASSLKAVTADIAVLPSSSMGQNWIVSATAAAQDAGPAVEITVGSGDVVTLRADAGSLPLVLGLTYGWSPTGQSTPLPDGGSLFSYQVAGANSSTASFTAPVVVGATRPMLFSVTVSADAGLTPLQRQAQVTVNVEDRQPPVVINDTATGRGLLGVSVNFDEDVLLSSRTAVTIMSGVSGGVQVGNATQTGSRQITLVPHTPLVAGLTYRIEFTGTGLTDVSPNANVVPAQVSRIWVAGVSSSMPFVTVGEQSASPPYPGFLIKRAGPGTIQVFGRKKGSINDEPWFLKPQPLFSFNCTSPMGMACSVASVAPGALPMLTPGGSPPLKRGHVWGTTPLAMLQAKGISNAGSTVVLTSDSNGVPQLPLGIDAGLPGPISTDGTKLYSLGANGPGAVDLRIYDAVTNTSSLETVSLGGSLPTGGHLAVAAIGPHVFFAASTGITTEFVRNAPMMNWLTLTSTIGKTTQPRLLPASDMLPTPGFMVLNLVDVTPATLVEQRLSAGPADLPSLPNFNLFGLEPSTWITSFDASTRNGLTWVAWVSGGILRVSAYSSFQVAGVRLPGAHPSPAGALNVDPACEAAYPEIVWIEDYLWVTWQEKCLGQQWKIAYRAFQ